MSTPDHGARRHLPPDMPQQGPGGFHPVKEPMLNIPPVIVALSALMIGIHLIRQFLSEPADVEIILQFAFWPLRYADVPLASALPQGGADVWSFFTYAFLHGGWDHIIFNMAWMLVFGSPLAQRFDPLTFVVFFLVCAAGGALTHLVLHMDSDIPVIGASASVSGMTAAAILFIFKRGGPLGGGRRSDPATYRQPAMTLAELVSSSKVRFYVLMWMGLNFVFGVWSGPLFGASIAWEAHVGGFVTGLIFFPLMDPVRRRKG